MVVEDRPPRCGRDNKRDYSSYVNMEGEETIHPRIHCSSSTVLHDQGDHYFSVLVKEVSLHLPTFYIRDSLTFPELFWDCIEFTCVRHVDRVRIEGRTK